MAGLKGVTAVLALALKVAMLAAFAIGGLAVGRPAIVGVVLAAILLVVLILVWGAFLAPRAARRLSFPARFGVEFALVGASAAALWAAGHEQSAIALGVLIVARFGLGLATGLDRDGL